MTENPYLKREKEAVSVDDKISWHYDSIRWNEGYIAGRSDFIENDLPFLLVKKWNQAIEDALCISRGYATVYDLKALRKKVEE